jgi:hypothetical protein
MQAAGPAEGVQLGGSSVELSRLLHCRRAGLALVAVQGVVSTCPRAMSSRRKPNHQDLLLVAAVGGPAAASGDSTTGEEASCSSGLVAATTSSPLGLGLSFRSSSKPLGWLEVALSSVAVVEWR